MYIGKTSAHIGILLVFSFLLSSNVWGKGGESTPMDDVRVLIDVSGSMKKNDPHNLRAPALRLLSGLLPIGAHGGIWTFGKYVTVRVPPAKVSESWKKQTHKASLKIDSLSQRTDIEKGLQRASADWRKPDPRYRRNIILLTDGLVDVGKDPTGNKASRRRILTKVLPRLKQLGVVIHAVALSESADHELLKKLSLATDGWYERVDSAEQLNRVFLRLREKTAPVDTLPLKDNRFAVDASVKDMTLLVFRTPKAKPTLVKAPDGAVYGAKGKLAEKMRWQHEDGYDLVTVENPVKGNWVIQAEVDPDNRVMVMTNLRLAVEGLPNHLVLGDLLSPRASIIEDGKTVSRRDFLKLVEFTSRIGLAETDPVNRVMRDSDGVEDEKQLDGVYSVDPVSLLESGNYSVVVQASGATFSREYRQQVQVHESPVTITIDEIDGKDSHHLMVEARPDLVNPSSVTVSISDAGKMTKVPSTKENRWEQELSESYSGKMVEILVEGTQLSGRHFNVQVAKHLKPKKVALPPPPLPPPPEPVKEELIEETGGEPPQPPDSEDTANEFRWVSLAIWILVANLFAGTAIWGGIRYMRKRRAKALHALEQSLEE